jgi:hypothetical protein
MAYSALRCKCFVTITAARSTPAFLIENQAAQRLSNQAKGWRRKIVSLRSGPVDTISIGISHKASIRAR